jgi:hypothetical protein
MVRCDVEEKMVHAFSCLADIFENEARKNILCNPEGIRGTSLPDTNAIQ